MFGLVYTWGLIGYPSDTHLKLKSRDVSFAHNSFCSCPIVSKFGTEHDNDTAVPYAKIQNDWTTEWDVMDDRVIAGFEFKTGFGQIPYIVQPPRQESYRAYSVMVRHIFHIFAYQFKDWKGDTVVCIYLNIAALGNCRLGRQGSPAPG